MQGQYGYGYQAPDPTPFDPMIIWLLVGALIAIGVLALLFIQFMRNFLYIARPNEALVFSGKRSTTEENADLGYTIVKSGHYGIRIPFLQTVNRMDMTTQPTDILVQNAYSRGNIALEIHAVANVKIHSDERWLRNAVERFLNRSRNEIEIVAKQTLEGAVREVVAQLTPEEVNQDRLKFAEKLIHAAEDDLQKLGLQLDTLKIQHVSDATGYLDSIGRPVIARALRDAENAENQAGQETQQAQAEANRRAEVSRATAQTAMQKKQNELRQVKAQLEGDAQAVEREAEVAAKTARATAEKELQGYRAALEQRRLTAEIVIPAQIRQQAQTILAKGQAAPTIENGAAQVEVLKALTEAWTAMGTDAREIYVIQHLEQIIGAVVTNVEGIDVGEVNVIDMGDGQALASYAATYPKMVASVMSALKESTGVDVPGILAGSRKAGELIMGSFFLACFALLIILGIAAVAVLGIIRNILYVCEPSEVLVFSGRARKRADGKPIGYRFVKGGRATRVPLFETVDRMDLTNMIIELHVKGAYSRNGIPLTVHGVANIKIPGEEPLIDQALERFLGKSRVEIMEIGRETLEGNLRGVLAGLTPEQVNQDKEAFASRLTEEAEHDLSHLGLVLDTLKIQNVTDESGYLDAMGRVASAAIRRDAVIAEANAKADAAEQKWRNTMNAEVQKLDTQIQVANAENARRIAEATARRGAVIAEQQAEVQANIAQTQAEVQMQEARIEQVKLQLQADVIQPAEAARQQAEQNAKADAAKIIEQGRATANVLKNLAATYRGSGTSARDVLLMQKLVPMLQRITESMGSVKIDRLTVIGSGGAGGGGSLAGQLVSTSEQIKAATGIDVPQMIKDRFGSGEPPAPAPRPTGGPPVQPAPRPLTQPPPRGLPPGVRGGTGG